MTRKRCQMCGRPTARTYDRQAEYFGTTITKALCAQCWELGLAITPEMDAPPEDQRGQLWLTDSVSQAARD